MSDMQSPPAACIQGVSTQSALDALSDEVIDAIYKVVYEAGSLLKLSLDGGYTWHKVRVLAVGEAAIKVAFPNGRTLWLTDHVIDRLVDEMPAEVGR